MSKASDRARINRFHRRLRENGGMHTTLNLSRSATQALKELMSRHNLTSREAVEAALLDAAVRGDAFEPDLGKMAKEYGLSPEELRFLPKDKA